MAMRIRDLVARDIRFPTSRENDGSDALNRGDYSATYVVLETNEGLRGHGLTFTNGRGNEVVVAAARALAPLVVGRELCDITKDMRGFYYSLAQDPQLRWLGPEKGILHMATGAVVNAVWDLWARREGKPLWKLLVDLTPQAARGLHRLHLDHGRAHARRRRSPCCARRKRARPRARPRCAPRASRPTRRRPGGSATRTTRCRRLCEEAVAAGWTHLKMKVGKDLEPERAACGAHPRDHRPARHADDGRQPVLGRARGHRADEGAGRASIPGGSRSPRARTTCWATRPSPGRSRRSRSRRARPARTA